MKRFLVEIKNRFSTLTQTKTILLFSLFLVLFHNITFFKKVLEVYAQSPHRVFYIFSLAVILFAVMNLLFTLMRSKYTTKPVLILVLLLSSMTSYFIDHYRIVVDDIMLLNVRRTNLAEALDLFSFQFVLYFIFLGILPSIVVSRIKILDASFKAEVFSKVKNIVVSLVVIFVMLLISGKFYASFFRENKPLRYYTNPTYFFYSTGKQFARLFKTEKKAIVEIGKDSTIVSDGKRELVILVVGETARADHFSLNGHYRETNPLLKKEDVISFTHMSSCGTSTAISVPCMFSQFGREHYSDEKGKNTENLLDVLNHANRVNILWRDNNSDSKGVALRVAYEDYKFPPKNTICVKGECRDEGMLVGLQDYINSNKTGDILIVFHQMGNHGPAYFKRYPPEFEKFKPTCKTNELEKCSNEEIENAYDNAILYTDYFLSKVISILKSNTDRFETAMFYMSDHGESLGEKGVYLHGLPYFMAPEQQKTVGAILWFDEKMKKKFDFASLKTRISRPYSHDNLFHTILGMFDVETSVYNKKMDILRDTSIGYRFSQKDSQKEIPVVR